MRGALDTASIEQSQKLDIGPMPSEPERSSMRVMSTPAPISRLVLVGPERRARDEKIRRYRLARVRVEAVSRGRREDRFAHLRRAYD